METINKQTKGNKMKKIKITFKQFDWSTQTYDLEDSVEIEKSELKEWTRTNNDKLFLNMEVVEVKA